MRAIEWLEAPAKDASGKPTHDGGVADDKALSLARARRLEQASADAAMSGARQLAAGPRSASQYRTG